MRLLLIPALLATSLACVEDVGKDKVKAKVVDVPAAQAKKQAPVVENKAVDAYKVDASKSMIQALGAKITATHPIDFKNFTGKLGVSEGSLSGVSFEVPMKDLVADHPKLTAHLLNEDFFDIAKFPTSNFVSREIKPINDDKAPYTHEITGDLTIMGKTKRITFPATVKVDGGTVQANSEFVLNRQDFGVAYPGRPDDLIQDNVKMTIKLVATKG